MAKSENIKQTSHQVKVAPLAPPPPPPPGHVNKSSLHQKRITPQTLDQGLGHGIQQHKQLNNPADVVHNVVPTQHEQNEKYCTKLHRNRRQTGSICGGLLLMLVSGLHIGWGMWRTHNWPSSTSMSLFIFSIMTWPLGAIIGGCIGSALVTVLQKNIIYFITAAIMTFANLLLLIWDDQYAAIVIGRLLTSLAHGLVFIVLVIHAGENASKNMRGTILSTINCILYIAIYVSLQVAPTVQETADFSVQRILGIIALLFITASLMCTIIVTVETAPYLLRKNKPNDALESMKHLRGIAYETPQITREMEELTLMTIQDKQDNQNPFSNGNVKPLVLMIMIRLMAALTSNFLLYKVLIDFCQLILNNNRYAPVMIIAPRLAMSALQVLYADVFGRKLQIIVSSILAGLTLIGLGIALTFNPNYYIPSIFCMWFQLFCSMGIDQMSDVYLSEAFSTAKKAWSLTFVMGVEHTFQVFMTGMAFTATTSAGIYALLFITGIFVIAIGMVLVFTLPETRGRTLKEARDLFRNEKIFQPLCSSSPNA